MTAKALAQRPMLEGSGTAVSGDPGIAVPVGLPSTAVAGRSKFASSVPVAMISRGSSLNPPSASVNLKHSATLPSQPQTSWLSGT